MNQTGKGLKIQNYDAQNPTRIPGERWISFGNALTKAGHGLTLSEKRIVSFALSKLDSQGTIPHEIPRTKIKASEYAEVFDLDINTAYEQLLSASKLLYQRSISFFKPVYKKGERTQEYIKSSMRWIGQFNYHEGEGWAELYWWPKLISELMNLKKGNFTSYQLKQATALRSTYSWRLLEVFMRFKDTGWVEMSVEEFANIMEATEKQRKDFSKIRTKIIEPAVKELSEKDNWEINWITKKRGRRISAIRFEFSKDN